MDIGNSKKVKTNNLNLLSMFNKKILSILLFFNNSYTMGQDVIKNKDSLLFSNGIYLQNSNILIPWSINFTEINKYGNPRINKKNSFSWLKIVTWDSVMIIDNFKVNLFLILTKRDLTKNKPSKILSFRAFTDSATSFKMISYFEKSTGRNGYFVHNRKQTYYRWGINNVSVIVGKDKKNIYFFLMNKTYFSAPTSFP
jgi:hypothetical protein